MLRDKDGRFEAAPRNGVCSCGSFLGISKFHWGRLEPEDRAELIEEDIRPDHAGRCDKCHSKHRRNKLSPSTGRKGRGRRERGYVYEESEFFYGLGMTELEVARKLGIQIESLRRSRKRWLEREAA